MLAAQALVPVIVGLALLVAVGSQQCRTYFYLVDNASLCISSDFTEKFAGGGIAMSEAQCSLKCAGKPRCQAFSTAEGPCKLFVFDRCSKGVRNCSCSATGRVFVKKQAGLPPGKLCPSGYDVGQCGVRYKVFPSSGNWYSARQQCNSESGLVIMADVTDEAEMNFIDTTYKSEYFDPGHSMWFGGFQTTVWGKSKRFWWWMDCQISLPENTTLWGTSEPDDYYHWEVTLIRQDWHTGLGDYNASMINGEPSVFLCECLSPFESA